jgi:16S rRNA (uracil1498-N3)-methyltransferase
MSLFYSRDIDQNTIFLAEEESRHVKVLRLALGDKIMVTNGLGDLFETKLIKAGKRVELSIVNSSKGKPFQQEIHLYVSPTKSVDRLEWMVEKCGELGVSSIHFIKCRYSERKFLKTERLRKKAVSAMKQSGQLYVANIVDLEDFETAVSSINDTGIKLIAHCEDKRTEELFTADRWPEPLHIFIGPEGDFSVNEIELARKHGFQELDLGSTVLRTETAAMAATAKFRLNR